MTEQLTDLLNGTRYFFIDYDVVVTMSEFHFVGGHLQSPLDGGFGLGAPTAQPALKLGGGTWMHKQADRVSRIVA